MFYATWKDMLARFGETELIQLTDHDHVPPSRLDRRLIDTALADAQAEIDSHLARRYRLPLTGCANGSGGFTAPRVLVRLACDIARYTLHDDLAPEHEVRRRYRAVIDVLTAIADGDILLTCPLGDAPGETLPLAGAGETEYQFSPRQVTDADLKGFA
jgi:phage gp36-like protein